MVDTARQLLDELMGRNRNLDPSQKGKQLNWEDPEFCPFYMVKFCPHDLFVNTRADLGQCAKLHDDEAKRLYEEAKHSIKKIQYEDDFLRFCSNMINEVDRKIVKGKQRLQLMNSKLEGRPLSKQQEQLNTMNDKINKLVREAEEAGIRGDVEQAQGLMLLCDKLKEEKDSLMKQHEMNGWSVSELAASQEKQMEVCEVCGAFLIVGDAQQRIDDHLTGKQHLGYSRLRRAVDELTEKRRKERGSEDRRREESRHSSSDNSRRHRSRDYDDRRYRDDRRDRYDRRDRDNRSGRSERDHKGGDRRERSRRHRSRSRSRSH